MSEVQGQNQGATAVLDKKAESPAAPKKRRLFTRNGRPAAKAPAQDRPATLAGLTNTKPFVPEQRQPDQETGALTQTAAESVKVDVQDAGAENTEAKRKIDITVAGLEGQNGQDLLRATAAMDAHEKMQHLAAGGIKGGNYQRVEGKGLKIKAKNAVGAIKNAAEVAKQVVAEAKEHPVKFVAKIWTVGVVDSAVRAELERSGMQQMLILGTDALLPAEMKKKIQEIAQSDVQKQHDERSKLGKVAERGSKAMKIIKAERSALVQAEQQVAEKMRLAVEMPADELNKSENADLKAFAEQNKELIDGYIGVLSGQSAARDAMLEQLAISRELDDVTDAGKKLEGKAKDDFVKNVLMPTVMDAYAKKGELEGVDAELAIQHRLMDFGENLSHATDLLQKANEVAKAILKTEDHVKGAAAVKTVENFFADTDVNINLETLKDKSAAFIRETRSRATERAIKRLKENGGAAEVFTDGEIAAMAGWEAFNTTKAEALAAVVGAGVGYGAFQVTKIGGRVLGAWVGGTAVIAARVAHRVGVSHDRTVAAVRTAAARGETVGAMQDIVVDPADPFGRIEGTQKNIMREIVVAPMRGIEGTTKQLRDSLKQLDEGSLSEDQTRMMLAQIAAVTARDKAGDAAGIPLWCADQGTSYAIAKRDLGKAQLKLLNGLREKSSLTDLKALAARFNVDVSNSTSKDEHIDAIRAKLGKAKQDNISTGQALGDEIAAAFAGVDDETTSVKESKNKALKEKVKAQGKAVTIAGVFGATVAEGAFVVHDFVAPAPAMAAEYIPGSTSGQLPQMENVAYAKPLNVVGGGNPAELPNVDLGGYSALDGSESAGTPSPEPSAPSGTGSLAETIGKASVALSEAKPAPKNVDVFGKDGVWTKNAMHIDEREWHNNTGQGFHTLKGKNGELVLQHKGMKDTKDLSFTFDLPKGDNVEPLTIKANDIKDGALELDPNSDEKVTIITDNGKEVEMSQKELFAMLVDEEEFGKVKNGTDFASEVNTQHRDVFKLGGMNGKGKGTIEVTVLKTEMVNGKPKVHADVYATIRGTGKPAESIESSGGGVPRADTPAARVPMETSSFDVDDDGKPDVTVDYPGKLTVDTNGNVIVDGKADQVVLTKDEVATLQKFQTKLGTSGTYGLQYDRASKSFDLVDTTTNMTIVNDINMNGGKLTFTPSVDITPHLIDPAKPASIDNIDRFDIDLPQEKPVTVSTADGAPPQAVFDKHAVAFKEVDWVRKDEKDFHTIMRDDGDTLRLQQNGKAEYIYIRVAGKPMLAEATHETVDGKDISYVDLDLTATDTSADTVKLYSADGTPQTMKQVDLVSLLVDKKALNTYVDHLKDQGIIAKQGDVDIATQVHGGTKIFHVENPKDGKGSYVGAANVVTGEDGKPEVQYLSTIDANGKMPDRIATTEFILPKFEKSAGGFTLNGQKFIFEGDVSKLSLDKTTGAVMDTSINPSASVLSREEIAVFSQIPATDNFDIRYDGAKWDLVGKDGVTYVENLRLQGDQLFYTPTKWAEVKLKDGAFSLTPKEPQKTTITLPTTTPGTGTQPGMGSQPGTGTQPGAGNPGTGNPGASTPTPGATTSSPTPGATTLSPTPGATTSSPTPGAIESSAAAIPSATESSPAPRATTSSPAAAESSAAGSPAATRASESAGRIPHVPGIETASGFKFTHPVDLSGAQLGPNKDIVTADGRTVLLKADLVDYDLKGFGAIDWGGSDVTFTFDPKAKAWDIYDGKKQIADNVHMGASPEGAPQLVPVAGSSPVSPDFYLEDGKIEYVTEDNTTEPSDLPLWAAPLAVGGTGALIGALRPGAGRSRVRGAVRGALAGTALGAAAEGGIEMMDQISGGPGDGDIGQYAGAVVSPGIVAAGFAGTRSLMRARLERRRDNREAREAAAQFGANKPVDTSQLTSAGHATTLSNAPGGRQEQLHAQLVAAGRTSGNPVSFREGLGMLNQVGDWYEGAGASNPPTAFVPASPLQSYISGVMDTAVSDADKFRGIPRVTDSNKRVLTNILVNYATASLGYKADTFRSTDLTSAQESRLHQLITTATTTPAYFDLDAAPVRETSSPPPWIGSPTGATSPGPARPATSTGTLYGTPASASPSPAASFSGDFEDVDTGATPPPARQAPTSRWRFPTDASSGTSGAASAVPSPAAPGEGWRPIGDDEDDPFAAGTPSSVTAEAARSGEALPEWPDFGEPAAGGSAGGARTEASDELDVPEFMAPPRTSAPGGSAGSAGRRLSDEDENFGYTDPFDEPGAAVPPAPVTPPSAAQDPFEQPGGAAEAPSTGGTTPEPEPGGAQSSTAETGVEGDDEKPFGFGGRSQRTNAEEASPGRPGLGNMNEDNE